MWYFIRKAGRGEAEITTLIDDLNDVSHIAFSLQAWFTAAEAGADFIGDRRRGQRRANPAERTDRERLARSGQSGSYYAMPHPPIPIGLTGVVLYQGENNKFSRSWPWVWFTGMPPTGFELAGSDSVFYAAHAVIQGPDRIRIRHPLVKNPMLFRYAWRHVPHVNLVNGVDLPTGPFRSNLSAIPSAMTNSGKGALRIPISGEASLHTDMEPIRSLRGFTCDGQGADCQKDLDPLARHKLQALPSILQVTASAPVRHTHRLV